MGRLYSLLLFCIFFPSLRISCRLSWNLSRWYLNITGVSFENFAAISLRTNMRDQEKRAEEDNFCLSDTHFTRLLATIAKTIHQSISCQWVPKIGAKKALKNVRVGAVAQGVSLWLKYAAFFGYSWSIVTLKLYNFWTVRVSNVGLSKRGWICMAHHR